MIYELPLFDAFRDWPVPHCWYLLTSKTYLEPCLLKKSKKYLFQMTVEVKNLWLEL